MVWCVRGGCDAPGSPRLKLLLTCAWLTKRVDTFNIWKLQTREYVAIVRDWRSATRLRDRLGYVFGPPGWEPRTIDKSNAAASLVTSR